MERNNTRSRPQGSGSNGRPTRGQTNQRSRGRGRYSTATFQNTGNSPGFPSAIQQPQKPVMQQPIIGTSHSRGSNQSSLRLLAPASRDGYGSYPRAGGNSAQPETKSSDLHGENREAQARWETRISILDHDEKKKRDLVQSLLPNKIRISTNGEPRQLSPLESVQEHNRRDFQNKAYAAHILDSRRDRILKENQIFPQSSNGNELTLTRGLTVQPFPSHTKTLDTLKGVAQTNYSPNLHKPITELPPATRICVTYLTQNLEHDSANHDILNQTVSKLPAVHSALVNTTRENALNTFMSDEPGARELSIKNSDSSSTILSGNSISIESPNCNPAKTGNTDSIIKSDIAKCSQVQESRLNDYLNPKQFALPILGDRDNQSLQGTHFKNMTQLPTEIPKLDNAKNDSKDHIDPIGYNTGSNNIPISSLSIGNNQSENKDTPKTWTYQTWKESILRNGTPSTEQNITKNKTEHKIEQSQCSINCSYSSGDRDSLKPYQPKIYRAAIAHDLHENRIKHEAGHGEGQDQLKTESVLVERGEITEAGEQFKTEKSVPENKPTIKENQHLKNHHIMSNSKATIEVNQPRGKITTNFSLQNKEETERDFEEESKSEAEEFPVIGESVPLVETHQLEMETGKSALAASFPEEMPDTRKPYNSSGADTCFIKIYQSIENSEQDFKNNPNLNSGTTYNNMDKPEEKIKSSTRTVPMAVLNKVKNREDQHNKSEEHKQSFSSTVHKAVRNNAEKPQLGQGATGRQNKIHIEIARKKETLSENEQVSAEKQQYLKNDLNLIDNTASIKVCESTEENKGYNGTVPNAVGNNGQIRNRQHERNLISEAKEYEDCEPLRLLEISRRKTEKEADLEMSVNKETLPGNEPVSEGNRDNSTIIEIRRSTRKTQASSDNLAGVRAKFGNDQHDSKLKSETDEYAESAPEGLAETIEIRTENETSLNKGDFPGKDLISGKDKSQDLLGHPNLKDDQACTESSKLKEVAQIYSDTVPKSVGVGCSIRNDQHKSNQKSNLEVWLDYVNSRYAKDEIKTCEGRVIEGTGYLSGDAPVTGEKERQNLSHQHSLSAKTDSNKSNKSKEQNQSLTSSVPKVGSNNHKIENAQHDNTGKSEVINFTDCESKSLDKTIQTRMEHEATSTKQRISGNEPISVEEQKNLKGYHSLCHNADSTKLAEANQVYTGTVPKTLGKTAQSRNGQHGRSAQTVQINEENLPRNDRNTEKDKPQTLLGLHSLSDDRASTESWQSSSVPKSIGVGGTIRKAQHESKPKTPVEKLLENIKLKNATRVIETREASNKKQINLETSMSKAYLSRGQPVAGEEEQQNLEFHHTSSDKTAVNKLEKSKEQNQSLNGTRTKTRINNDKIRNDQDVEYADYESKSLAETLQLRGENKVYHKIIRNEETLSRTESGSAEEQRNLTERYSQNGVTTFIGTSSSKGAIKKSQGGRKKKHRSRKKPQEKANRDMHVNESRVETDFSRSNLNSSWEIQRVDNSTSTHNKNEINGTVDRLEYKLAIANKCEQESKLSCEQEGKRREYNCPLVDEFTGSAISPETYKRVILKLNEIMQKAEPFAELIDVFEGLEGSNQHYYIEKSLRRLIYRLDDMFDDIGEVTALREARKQVYKFIFPLFERLDEKVLKNKQTVQTRREYETTRTKQEISGNEPDSGGDEKNLKGYSRLCHDTDSTKLVGENEVYTGTVPKTFDKEAQSRNEQHEGKLKSETKTYAESASGRSAETLQINKISSNEENLPRDDRNTEKDEPQTLLSIYSLSDDRASTAYQQFTEVAPLYSGSVPKPVSVDAKNGTDQHESKPKTPVQKLSDNII